MTEQITLYYSTTNPSDPVGNITNTIDLSDYNGEGSIVMADKFSVSQGLYSSRLAPITDQVSFKIRLKTTLANTILNLPQETVILVDINIDGSDFFYGYIRPSIKFDVTGDVDFIDLDVLENTYRLDRIVSDTVRYNDLKICDPADTSNSLVHQILNEAAGGTWPSGEIAPGILTDTRVVKWVRIAKEESTYRKYLENILLSYQLIYITDSQGRFDLVDIKADSVTAATTYNDNNIIGALTVDRTLPDDDGVEVNFRQVASTEGVLCSQQYNEDGEKYLEIDSGETKPAADERLIKFSAQEKSLIFYLPVLSGFGSNTVVRQVPQYSHRDFSDWKIVSITDGVIDLRIDKEPAAGGVVTTHPQTITGVNIGGSGSKDVYQFNDGTGVFFGTFYWSCTEDGLDAYFTSSATNVRLVSLSLKGDFEAITENGPAITNSNAYNPTIVTTDYIYDETEADTLATWHQTRLDNGAYTYKFFSRDESDCGDYVAIQSTDLNISVKARVIKKVFTLENDVIIYRYECEGVDDLQPLYGLVTQSQPLYIPPTSSMEGISASVSNGLSYAGNIVKSVDGNLLDSITPNESGLYLTSEYVGYYNEPGSAWSVYIKNDGDFLFRGDDANKVEWDGSKLSVYGDLFLSGDSEIQGTVSVGDTLTVAGDLIVSGSAAITGTLSVGSAIDMDGSGVGIIDVGSGVEISGGSAGVITVGVIELDGAGSGEINIDDSLIMDGANKRYSVYDSVPTLKAALGYLGGIKSYTTSQYGLYIADGNVVRFEGGAELADNNYTVKENGALIIEDATGSAVAKFGSVGAGEIAAILGFSGSDLDTPVTGDQRNYADKDESGIQYYTVDEWSTANQCGYGGTDNDGVFTPFSYGRGFRSSLADPPASEPIPTVNSRYVSFENGFLDQNENSPSRELGNPVASSTWSKFGTYSLGSSFDSGSLRWDAPVDFNNSMGASGWFYFPGTGISNSQTFISFTMYQDANNYISIAARHDSVSQKHHCRVANMVGGVLTNYESPGITITYPSERHFGIFWDANTMTGYLILDDSVDSIDASLATIPSSISQQYFTCAAAASPQPIYYADDLVFASGDFVNTDLFIQHYEADQPWSADYTAEDVVLVAGENGSVRSKSGHIFEEDIDIQQSELQMNTGGITAPDGSLMILDGNSSLATSAGAMPIEGYDICEPLSAKVTIDGTDYNRPVLHEYADGIARGEYWFGEEYENLIVNGNDDSSWTDVGTAVSSQSGDWIEITGGATPSTAYSYVSASLTGAYYGLVYIEIENVDATVTEVGINGSNIDITWATPAVNEDATVTEIDYTFQQDNNLFQGWFWVDATTSVANLRVYPDKTTASKTVKVKNVMLVDFASVTPSYRPYVDGIQPESKLAYSFNWLDYEGIGFRFKPCFNYDTSANKYLVSDLAGSSSSFIFRYQASVDLFLFAIAGSVYYFGHDGSNWDGGTSSTGDATAFTSGTNDTLIDEHIISILWDTSTSTDNIKIWIDGDVFTISRSLSSWDPDNSVSIGSTPLYTVSSFSGNSIISQVIAFPTFQTTEPEARIKNLPYMPSGKLMGKSGATGIDKHGNFSGRSFIDEHGSPGDIIFDEEVDGVWVTKWRGGRMQQMKIQTLTSRVAFGSGTYADPYRSTVHDWTFPIPFIEAPNVFANGEITSATAAERANSIGYNSITATAASGIQAVAMSSNSTASSVKAHLTALGRWK